MLLQYLVISEVSALLGVDDLSVELLVYVFVLDVRLKKIIVD